MRAVLAALLLASAVSEARSYEPGTGTIGLVSVPIFTPDPDGPPGSRRVPPGTRIEVRAKPDGSAGVVAVLSTSGAVTAKGELLCEWYGEVACESLEIDYEVPALIALERNGEWTRVVITEKTRGWVKAGTFVPLPKLLQAGLVHLRSFDGTLFAAPAGKALAALAVPADAPAKAVDFRTIGKVTWMKVEVLDGICGEGEGKTMATGWIPLVRPDGSPAAWFYSRGC